MPHTLEGVVVPVRIYLAPTFSDLLGYYRKINKNYQPHTLYDLDDMTRIVVDGFIQWLEHNFDHCFFSKSVRPNRPNLSHTQIKDECSHSRRFKELIESCGGDTTRCIQQLCEKNWNI